MAPFIFASFGPLLSFLPYKSNVQTACVKPFLACLAAKVFPDGQPEGLENPPFPFGRMETQQLQLTRPRTGKRDGPQAADKNEGGLKSRRTRKGRNKLQKASWDRE